MKQYNIILMFIQLIFTDSLGSLVDVKLFSSSPIGPYRVVLKNVYNCNTKKNNKIQFNPYLSHGKNNTIVLGNSTSTIPIDDNLFLEMRMAVKDSFSVWKENVYMHKSPNACSTVKQLLGKAWSEIINGYGVSTVDCPIPPGSYTFTGIDLQSIWEKSNLPKVFMYGTYKFHIYYTRNKDIFGCQGFIFDLMRP